MLKFWSQLNVWCILFLSVVSVLNWRQRQKYLYLQDVSTKALLFFHIFPDIKKKLNDSLVQYQDKYKQWLKSQLENISYFNNLRSNLLETLVYKLQSEFFEEG